MPGDRLLDVACGAGLALELAGLRGARCAGIDASPRLIAVARDRNPDADLRVGDMHALPWDDGAFTVVTSFRGIWGTTPGAVREVHRVLAPGGRVGLTVWGHIKASPGAWALAPFALASAPKVEHQASMVALGRPGAGEALLHDAGFVDIERIDIPFVFEFADPEVYRAGHRLDRSGLRGHRSGGRDGVPAGGGRAGSGQGPRRTPAPGAHLGGGLRRFQAGPTQRHRRRPSGGPWIRAIWRQLPRFARCTRPRRSTSSTTTSKAAAM